MWMYMCGNERKLVVASLLPSGGFLDLNSIIFGSKCFTYWTFSLALRSVIFASLPGFFISLQKGDFVLLSSLLQHPETPHLDSWHLAPSNTQNLPMSVSGFLVHSTLAYSTIGLIDIFTQNLINTTNWCIFKLLILSPSYLPSTPQSISS